MIRRTLLTLILAASSLLAETVYFTPNGKKFHTSEHCMSLFRTRLEESGGRPANPRLDNRPLLHAERVDAEKHGLVVCGICNRAKKAKAEAKNAWAVTK